MRIVMINGSPRQNGATAGILHALEKELLLMNDVTIDFLDVSKLNILPCKGCMSCYRTGKCHIVDDGDMISEIIEAADGIVIGSPTYASNVSGQLKQLIDRGHFVMEQLLYGKYAVSVATGVNYGSQTACKVIDDLFLYSGAFKSGKIVCNVPFNSDPCNEVIKRKINKAAKSLYEDIKYRKSHPIQKVIHGIIYSFGIKPFVRAHQKEYEGVMEKWERNSIV